MFLIDDIILAPVKGVYHLVKVIKERAEEELYNPQMIQEELMQLQLQFELDQISEEEYDSQEEKLLQRLAESKKMGRE
ncbi:MAG: gas vesicle protein GvpG [Bacteroidota bacterium]